MACREATWGKQRTLLLSEDEHPKVVQELLGHAQVSITLDRYSHMTPRLMSNAAAVMDREPPVKMGRSLMMGMVLPAGSDPEPP